MKKTILMNLTRDIKNNTRDTEVYKKIQHTLIGNTAFINSFNKVIKRNKEKCYTNNNVNSTENYDNTSKECYDNGILPYNSELVHPIIPYISDNINNYDCHGFICIDCKKPNAFIGKYHIPILEFVSDGIYDIISDRNNSKNIINTQNPILCAN